MSDRPDLEAAAPGGGRLRRALCRARPDLGPLRRAPEYRRLYAGQAASFAGLMITYVALPYQAYQLTRSSLVVGLLSFAELVPLVVAALLGGLLADRADRRRLILAAEAAGLVTSVILAVNALAWHQLWVLFALAVVMAAVMGLQRPSLESLVPLLVAREDMAAAASLTGLLGNAAQILGPALAGALIAAAGLPAAYLADGATCLIALPLFAGLRAIPPAAAGADRPGLAGITEGLRYARGRPEILGSYLIDMAAMFFGAPYALFPALAARLAGNPHHSPAVLGLLYAAPGAGALLVSATCGWVGHVRRHGRAIALAVCGWGLAIAVLGVAPGLPWALAALAAAGGADEVSGIFRLTLWNQTIPQRLRGRLAGLEMISYTTGTPLGNLESGLAVTLTGSTRIAIVSGGLACLGGAVLVTAALPMLWRYDSRSAANSPADTCQPSVTG